MPMFAIKRGYVDVSIGQVHYRTAGEGPPVLMLHQSPSSSLQYERVIPFLAAAGLRVIAMDTPGFGMSDPPPSEPTIQDYAGYALEVMDWLGLDRVTLVGHHTGATAGWELAGAHPERIERLIVSGAGLYTPEERARWQAFVPEERIDFKPDGSHVMKIWNRGGVPSDDRELAIKQRGLVQVLMSGENVWWGHNAAFNYDVEPRVKTVSCPILIVTNDGDMIYVQAMRTAKLRPDAKLVVLKGGTHNITDEQPEAWAQAIIDFIGRRRLGAGVRNASRSAGESSHLAEKCR